ncbi:hypothetical protein EZS27_009117 [termite gut metagenome]|uniref:O-antigen ligase-related domain-containing protein n=1 Tax=termite gut metagenome TaxID=433724 RepID=A0A5J4SBB3_9ZZZZ
MNVQSQYAYGFLRFSPGAYPNEFGVMSAYFCVLSIYFIITRCVFFNKKYLYFLFLLSFVGMFLATTRAAYISFIISIVYIFLSFKLKMKMKFITFILLIIMVLIVFIPNDILQFVLTILNTGYNSAIDSTGSISERYEAWDYGWNFFKLHPFLGVGFESPKISMIHNTYLQFLFGFGFVGIFFLLSIFFVICFCFRYQYKNIYKGYNQHYRHLAIIGLINVSLFALSNHNQNQFLTWFTVFLFLSSGCLCKGNYNYPKE